MPLSRYDSLFGGKGGASKAKAAMEETYGEEKGEKVFYATKNKKKGKMKKKHSKEAQKRALKNCK